MINPQLIHAIPPPPSLKRRGFVVMPSELPKEQLDDIEGFGDVLLMLSGEPGMVGAGPVNGYADGRRKSDIAWIKHQPETAWLYNAFGQMVNILNAQHFHLDISGIYEDIQYTTYGEHGHFDWHMDLTVSSLPTRKLALVMLLSDPSAFTGGEFQVNLGAVETVPLKRGDIIVFPSWVLHRVTPIESGQRKSLVCWIHGTPYK